ncbi:MAG: metallophosphoesterase [Cytophagales bacterium]|nr:metallophosphoesterase [Cytophagales bacterium]
MKTYFKPIVLLILCMSLIAMAGPFGSVSFEEEDATAPISIIQGDPTVANHPQLRDGKIQEKIRNFFSTPTVPSEIYDDYVHRDINDAIVQFTRPTSGFLDLDGDARESIIEIDLKKIYKASRKNRLGGIVADLIDENTSNFSLTITAKSTANYGLLDNPVNGKSYLIEEGDILFQGTVDENGLEDNLDDHGNRVLTLGGTGSNMDALFRNFLGKISSEEWNSIDIKRRLNSAKGFFDEDKIAVAVTLIGQNARVFGLRIPGYDYMHPLDIFPDDYYTLVTVTKPDGTTKNYRFDVTNGEYDDSDPNFIVDAVMGDKINFEVVSPSGSVPQIEGVPDIWISGFSSSRAFMCNPDLTPGEYNEFIPWEDQVHMYMVNKYPPGFEVKVDDWVDNGSGGAHNWSWDWIAERRVDPSKTKYQADIKFPPIKDNFSYDPGGYQREDQSTGYAAELVHYWNRHASDNTYEASADGPRFLLDVDGDEILYIGTNDMDAIHTTDPDVYTLGPEFFTDKTTSSFLPVNWQYMWPGEALDVEYDQDGYPSAGYVVNDYISAYRKVKQRGDGNTDYDEYYKGYLIEDYGLWRQGNLKGSVIGGNTAEASPCASGCKYNPLAAWQDLPGATGQNNAHPGVIKITQDGRQISFRMRVQPPLTEDKGFYGTIKGTNTPMGWGQTAKYTLTGLKDLSDEERARYSLAVVTYKIAGYEDTDGGFGGYPYGPYSQYIPPYEHEEGAIVPYGGTTYIDQEVFWSAGAEGWDAATGEWSVDLKLESGWSVVVAYYNTSYEGVNEKSIVAGRDLWIMDPLKQITAPGSNHWTYAPNDIPFVGDGKLDLKEGTGERVHEYIRETRSKEDKERGFGGWGQTKYTREYVLQKGTKITFAATDVGTGKVEIWNGAGPPHLYMWRDLAKYMPRDTVAKYLKYIVSRVQENGFDAGELVHTEENEAYFTYTWNETGVFEIVSNFMDMPYSNGSIKVVVVDDYEADALDDLTVDKQRGNIEIRNLSEEERQWLLDKTGNTAADIARINNYMIAEIADVLSEYQFVKGPRANSFGHPFGGLRNFANVYKWYRDENEITDLDNEPWFRDFDPISFWPAEWNKVWLRHSPYSITGKRFPETQVNPENVLRDPAEPVFRGQMQRAFDLTSFQSEYGFVRWLPWLAESPYEGIKIANYTKPMVNLEEFFNGQNGSSADGAWSGNPYVTLPMLQTALGEETPISDDALNQLDFYHDLKAGKKLLFDITSTQNLVVKNQVPRVDPYFNDVKTIDHNVSLPNEVYMDGWAKETTDLRALAENSYEVFQRSRHENGMYYDTYKLRGLRAHPASVSGSGMGLVALTVADKMGWEASGEAAVLAEKTLETLTNHLRPGSADFKLSVTRSGYPLHWPDIETGQRFEKWDDEYSTIDAAIMVCGALFAKKYFSDNTNIARYADALFNSIDWALSIDDPATGKLHFKMNPNSDQGEGLPGSTSPFNEYMILAYLAHEQAQQQVTVHGANIAPKYQDAINLWDTFFNVDLGADENLPKSMYDSLKMLTDVPGEFIPSFTLQFIYFLCNDFTTSNYFMGYYDNAMKGDRSWWNDQAQQQHTYQWGLGEGSSPVNNGFDANSINNNPHHMVSPHVMAGFIPIDKVSVTQDIQDMLASAGGSPNGVYYMEGTAKPVLWRYSLDPQFQSWRSNEIQLVDWSKMVFGLASLFELSDNVPGEDFFAHYNDFDFPLPEQTFAAIGDYGWEGPDAQNVANMIDSWQVDFIISLGDDSYADKLNNNIDDNVGQYYHSYIFPYFGNYGAGSANAQNRFWPVLGNHDYKASDPPGQYLQEWLNFFTLPDQPAGERYYEKRIGDVHLFGMNWNAQEPDGRDETSDQALWLQDRLAASDAKFKLVYGHQTPYSSGFTDKPGHGSIPVIQWPYKDWGADLVLSGHEHMYERWEVDGMTYLVNGMGGAPIYSYVVDHSISPTPVVHHSGPNLPHAAMQGVVRDDPDNPGGRCLDLTMVDITGHVIDQYTICNSESTSGRSVAEEQVLATEEAFGEGEIDIYPNPARDILHVRFELDQPEVVSFNVVNLAGQLLKSNKVKGQAGSNTMQLGIQTLPVGIYVLEIAIGQDQLYKRRFIVK